MGLSGLIETLKVNVAKTEPWVLMGLDIVDANKHRAFPKNSMKLFSAKNLLEEVAKQEKEHQTQIKCFSK